MFGKPRGLILLTTALATALGACAPKVTHGPLLSPPKAGESFVLSGARVFDSRTGTFGEPADVWTAGPRIVAVTAPGQTPAEAPANAQRIDATGRYLMPGLVDSHVHIDANGGAPWDPVEVAPEENLESYLRAGITTVFDLGGMGKDLEALAQKTESGALLGPRVFHAHLHITCKDGHPIPLVAGLTPFPLNLLVGLVVPQVETEADVPGVIQDAIANDADYIKLVYDRMPKSAPRLSLDLLTALIDEAHAQGKKVVVHIGSGQNAVEAAEAGADLLAHGVYRTPVSMQQARRIARTKVPMIFTASVWHHASMFGRRDYQPDELDRIFVAEEQYRSLSDVPESGAPALMSVVTQTARDQPFWAPNIKTLYAAGVPMWVGTDSSLPGNFPGASLLQELALLHAAGIPTAELLQAATLWPAQWIGADPMFGVIEKGAAADLLVLDKDPTADLGTLHHPVHIMARGRLTAPTAQAL